LHPLHPTVSAYPFIRCRATRQPLRACRAAALLGRPAIVLGGACRLRPCRSRAPWRRAYRQWFVSRGRRRAFAPMPASQAPTAVSVRSSGASPQNAGAWLVATARSLHTPPRYVSGLVPPLSCHADRQHRPLCRRAQAVRCKSSVTSRLFDGGRCVSAGLAPRPSRRKRLRRARQRSVPYRESSTLQCRSRPGWLASRGSRSTTGIR
jgi:hypothetical protein